jgi:hypothetical protein
MLGAPPLHLERRSRRDSSHTLQWSGEVDLDPEVLDGGSEAASGHRITRARSGCSLNPHAYATASRLTPRRWSFSGHARSHRSRGSSRAPESPSSPPPGSTSRAAMRKRSYCSPLAGASRLSACSHFPRFAAVRSPVSRRMPTGSSRSTSTAGFAGARRVGGRRRHVLPSEVQRCPY